MTVQNKNQSTNTTNFNLETFPIYMYIIPPWLSPKLAEAALWLWNVQ